MKGTRRGVAGAGGARRPVPSRGAADPLAGAPVPGTLGQWLQWAEAAYARVGAAAGQMATDAHDEALYLLLHALGLPWSSGAEVLPRRLTGPESRRVAALFRRRLVDRVPAAYLTREAWLGDDRFYVDERVIIPRSYFLEIIPRLAAGPADGPARIADVCTGSGCLAILLARHFPQAAVDAIDLSPAALAVAKINVADYRLTRRVRLWRSDVFAAVPPARYDLIVSNPPYEPSALVAALPEEFRQEPRLALDGGTDGLDVIRRLLRQARTRLQPGGRVLIEVGGLRRAMSREFQALQPRWLATADGSDCVAEFRAARLLRWEG
jgi:ribosomal protein L3 glutamine methyltransferase